MRINNINPISFGYSKKSQAYLDKKIKEEQDPILKEALQQTSISCNQLEANIKQREKKGQIRSFDQDVELFGYLKDALLNNVVGSYSDSQDYIVSEYKYYANALNRMKNPEENNWRAQIIKHLKMFDLNLGKSEQELKDELSETKAQMEIAALEREEQTNPDYYDEDEDNVESVNVIPSAPAAEGKPAPKDGPGVVLIRKNDKSPDGFKDIVGMETLKQELQEGIVDPVRDPEQAKLDKEEYGKEPIRSALLFGPPGCGKTFIIEAMSAEIDSPTYTMDASTIGSKYINQSSINVGKAFKFLKEQAKVLDKPVVLFIDEMDGLTKSRKDDSNDENLKLVGTLLKEIEDAQKHNVIVIGATNKINLVDPAVVRRFKIKELVPAPNREQIKLQIENNLKNKTKAQAFLQDEENVNAATNLLSGYSYHSINNICDKASINAMRRDRADIALEDFIKAESEANEQKPKTGDYKMNEKKAAIGFGD